MEELINVLQENTPDYDYLNGIEILHNSDKIYSIKGDQILKFKLRASHGKIDIKYFDDYTNLIARLRGIDRTLTMITTRSSYNGKKTHIIVKGTLKSVIYKLDGIQLLFKIWRADSNE